MISFLASLFGFVLKVLYDIVKNYGLAIILFSILVKLLMLPLTMKQQKTMQKNEKLQKEMKQIQFKYKNDQEKMNQEMMALYKREGMSPFSGCLSSILQIILLFSVFFLVRSPLTFMEKLDEGVINDLKSVVEQQSDSKIAYPEIAIIQYIKNNYEEIEKDKKIHLNEKQEENQNEENTEQVENNSESSDKTIDLENYLDKININMDFFGIDLSQVPTQDLKNWKSWIIPVLYVISSFISIRLTSAMTKKKKENKNETNSTDLVVTEDSDKKEDYNPMEDATKTMSWMMPIMSISIAIIAPLGLALYWLMNNLLMIIERLVFNKIYKKEEAEKNA